MKRSLKAVSCTLAVAIGAGTLVAFAGCRNKGSKNDTLVVMTQELNGLFNPFYSTAGTDMDVVGQTQISMFTTDSNGDIAFGSKEAVVVLDYESKAVGNTTEYYFVIKNGIKFSDGTPLTMNDILFNMYVYLDPAYTGSTTMYSTKIQGLQSYRTQLASSSTDQDDTINSTALDRYETRLYELVNLYQQVGRKPSGSYEATPADMRAAIAEHMPSSGYKRAIAPGGTISDDAARTQLLADYNRALELFEEELGNDYNAAWDSYQVAPYTNQRDENGNLVITNESDYKFDQVGSFMFAEGFCTVEYAKDPVTNKDNKNHIKTITPNYNTSVVKDRESAIKYVFDTYVENQFINIITGWQTASTLQSEFVALAKDVILHENLGDSEELNFPSISGIRSLGHAVKAKNSMPAWSYTDDSITVNGTSYKIAKTHKADGTPANSGENDVLRITIDGTDPKAVWNFGFTVAPYHYYSDPANYSVDIEESKFGVAWASFPFHNNVIQGTNQNGVSKNKVPLGAGAYVASDRNNSDKPSAGGFVENNVNVFYKANENFFVGVEGADASLHPANVKKLRYQVVSSTNAINQLETGGVHFIEPQFTSPNYDRIVKLGNKGIKSLSSWQLGYGYIGINAGKVENINLRRAIMAAMDTRRALNYYRAGTVKNIDWPMSLVSWAYPRTADGVDSTGIAQHPNTNNLHDYTQFVDDETAKTRIREFMAAAHVSEGPSLKFTIAGSDLTDHPCYEVFRHAAELLNDCGWSVEVVPDTYALTKLATGSLAVWAAAWGSTIDPDMYQVYHKNSTATSVYSWGYREILANPSRTEENKILTDLSKLIDEGRTIESDTKKGKAQRSAIYQEAMGFVLDLAVELPVYQRQTLYAYNAKVIDENTFQHDEEGKVLMNPYSSPLGRIWEINFVK